MTIRLPKPKTKARFLLIGYGLIILIWMSLEDKNALSVSVLGTGASIIYLGTWIANHFGERELAPRVWFSGAVLSGTTIGAASSLITAFLMFFKTSWHSHIFPDYPFQMIAATFSRMPIWALSGAFFGLSFAIALLLKRSQNPTQLPDS